MLAGEDAPVVWLHCNGASRSTRMYLLHPLVWKIIEQRPDILLKRMRDQHHYIRLFREADTFESLWTVLLQIAVYIRELWVVIDSIHDCKDGNSILIRNLGTLVDKVAPYARIKVVISSRHMTDLSGVTTNILEYTAADMREGILHYVHQQLEAQGQASFGLATQVTDVISSVGGGLHWARAVVDVLRGQTSEASLKGVLSVLTTQEAIIHRLWTRLVADAPTDIETLLKRWPRTIPPHCR